ncbi:MAG: prolyl-tRNA synthetase associated domain-containing protein [Bacillota bacterium]|nr:prolyl-tRNA synthetase associated domain-containing protein [Bacillota bacterium]
MISKEESRVYEALEGLGIPYKKYEHKAVFTVEEANNLDIRIPGGHCKNIFVCDKKKETYILVVLPDEKSVNFKELSNKTGYKGLKFASEEMLEKYLGLKAGSVSPFGLVNDDKKKVEVIIDKDIFRTGLVGFHPNVNTSTLTVTSEDFRKFLEGSGNKVRYMEL